MKDFLTLLFISTVLIGKSQTWPETDSKWTYCNRIDDLISVGTTVFEYTHDSLVGGVNYAVVRPTTWFENPQTYQESLEDGRVLLFRQSNDTIYRRVAESEYVFFINGIEVGDSFTTFRSSIEHPNQYSCLPYMVLEVVEVTQLEINGELHRNVTLEDIYFEEVYSGALQTRYFNFTEGMGLNNNFPYFNSNADILNTECMDFIDGTTTSTLTEYNDEVLSGLSCFPNSTRNPSASTFYLYPNPATDHVFWNDNIISITIFDAQGKMVLQKTEILNQKSLSLNGLENGFYTTMVQIAGVFHSRKLIVAQ